MGEAAEHEFHPKHSAPPLQAAIRDLAERSGRDYAQFDGMKLGDAYELACATYGDDLPEFWRVWASWNDAPEDPAPMGEL